MYKLIVHGIQSSLKIESMHTHSKAGAVAKQESCKTIPGDIEYDSIVFSLQFPVNSRLLSYLI